MACILQLDPVQMKQIGAIKVIDIDKTCLTCTYTYINTMQLIYIIQKPYQLANQNNQINTVHKIYILISWFAINMIATS